MVEQNDAIMIAKMPDLIMPDRLIGSETVRENECRAIIVDDVNIVAFEDVLCCHVLHHH